MFRVLVLLVACGSPKPLPASNPVATSCTGLPMPALGPKAESTSTGRASIITLNNHIYFSAVGHGSFAQAQVSTTQAFELADDRVVPLGELAHRETGFLRGALWATEHGFSTCDHRRLPELANVAAIAVDGDIVSALVLEGQVNRACTGLVASTSAMVRITYYTLDLRDAKPEWMEGPSSNEPATVGSGCRGITVLGADARARTAVLETCTHVDAGDSISLQDCSIRLWHDVGGTTTLAVDSRDTIALEGMRVAITPLGGDTRLFRYDRTRLVGDGTLEGTVIAMDGARAITAKSGGNRPGSIGVGFQIRAFDGSTPTTDWLDVDNARDLAFAWIGDRIIGVLPEDQRDRNPVTVRVVEARDGKWRDIATANVIVAP